MRCHYDTNNSRNNTAAKMPFWVASVLKRSFQDLHQSFLVV